MDKSDADQALRSEGASITRPKLWPFQAEILTRCEQAAIKNDRILVVSPCGSGKTIMLSDLALRRMRKGPVLILSHRREILRQTVRTLQRLGADSRDVESILYGHRHGQRRAVPKIVVCSKDSLVRRSKLPTVRDPVTVIVDECHRVLARGYRRLVDRFPNAVHFGFTATPIRHDGQLLSQHYQHVIMGPGPEQLIAEDVIADPRVFTVPNAFLPDVFGVETRAGDYDPSQLEERVLPSHLIGGIVDHYRSRAAPETAVCFCVSIRHAQAVRERFVAAGVSAEVVHHDMSTREREAILAAVADGRVNVIVNCMILGEGWDLPRCRAVILARPTRSLGLYLQQCGRAFRKGEVRPIILDHGGNVGRFHLPQADRDFSAAAIDPTGGARPIRVCSGCQAVYPMGLASCPECGESVVKRAAVSVPLETEDQLRELGLTSLATDLLDRARILGLTEPEALVRSILRRKQRLLSTDF